MYESKKLSREEFLAYCKAAHIKECCVSNCNNRPEVDIIVEFHDYYLTGNEIDFGFRLVICKRCKGLFHKNMKSITDIPLV